MSKRLSAKARTNSFILILLLAALASGYNYFFHPFASRALPLAPTPVPSPVIAQVSPEPSAAPVSVEDRAREIVRSMSVSRKVALIVAASVQVPQLDPGVLPFLAEYQPGVVVLFGSSVSTESAKSTIEAVRAATGNDGANVVIAVDHEGGSVARLSGPGFLRLPSWQALCAMNQTNRAAALAQSARELATAGVDMVFGPVLDSGPGPAALGSRICSGDQQLVASASSEFATSFAQQGIVSVFKHFPGIGGVTTDLHDAFSAIETNPQELQVFRTVLGQFPNAGVMTAHVGVKNQNAELPCSLSKDCIGQLSSVFPSVLVVSDGLDMPSAQYQGQGKPLQSVEDTALQALLAGNDLLVFGGSMPLAEWQSVHDRLVVEYQRSAEVAARVDDAAVRVLLLQ